MFHLGRDPGLCLGAVGLVLNEFPRETVGWHLVGQHALVWCVGVFKSSLEAQQVADVVHIMDLTGLDADGNRCEVIAPLRPCALRLPDAGRRPAGSAAPS